MQIHTGPRYLMLCCRSFGLGQCSRSRSLPSPTSNLQKVITIKLCTTNYLYGNCINKSKKQKLITHWYTFSSIRFPQHSFLKQFLFILEYYHHLTNILEETIFLEQNLCLPVEKWLTSIRFAPFFVVFMQAMSISMPGINLTDSIALTKANTK